MDETKKKKTRKCGYKNCRHQEIVDLENDKYIKDNGRYYHTDCKHEKDVRAEIIKYWYENIDKGVPVGLLVNIVERLICKESFDCDYVLWALKQRSKYIKHPHGLALVVKDEALRNEWDAKHIQGTQK